MNILVNNVSKVIPDSSNLEKALDVLGVDTEGVAIAVNREIIHRDSWGFFRMEENDVLDIFKLVVGG